MSSPSRATPRGHTGHPSSSQQCTAAQQHRQQRFSTAHPSMFTNGSGEPPARAVPGSAPIPAGLRGAAEEARAHRWRGVGEARHTAADLRPQRSYSVLGRTTPAHGVRPRNPTKAVMECQSTTPMHQPPMRGPADAARAGAVPEGSSAADEERPQPHHAIPRAAALRAEAREGVARAHRAADRHAVALPRQVVEHVFHAARRGRPCGVGDLALAAEGRGAARAATEAEAAGAQIAAAECAREGEAAAARADGAGEPAAQGAPRAARAPLAGARDRARADARRHESAEAGTPRRRAARVGAAGPSPTPRRKPSSTRSSRSPPRGARTPRPKGRGRPSRRRRRKTRRRASSTTSSRVRSRAPSPRRRTTRSTRRCGGCTSRRG